MTRGVAKRVKATKMGGSAPIWHQGWYKVGDKTIFFRSLWEKKYACWLNWLKERGDILDWQYEPREFWFDDPALYENKALKPIRRGVVSNKLDFLVHELDGTKPYHEVKGRMDRRSQTRLNRMALYYPSVKIVLIRQKDMAAISFMAGRMVPGWCD